MAAKETTLNASSDRCPGTLTRRAFVRVGLAGLGSLGLADVLRLQGRGAANGRRSSPKSILVLWLWGGPSHMETFDLKPDAPSDVKSQFRSIATSGPRRADLRAFAAHRPRPRSRHAHPLDDVAL
jgi:hypothetical protein